MGRKLFSDKGPRPTAQDFADQRERTKRMQEFREREQRELDAYAAAVRAGDDKLAAQIALARRDRSRPMGVQKSESVRQAVQGTESAVVPPSADSLNGAALPETEQQRAALIERARESSADCRAAAEPGALEAGGYGDD